MDVNDARARLIRLQSERFHALELGIENPSPYMTRLGNAIADAQRDYTMRAVIEIATLRGTPADATQG